MMSNPCECCQGKIKFIRKINGNSMHSMVMPERFLNYFGGKTPGVVKLEAPSGITYDVRVTQNMNRTILKSGWEGFVDANQIEENYSLMFRYLGNSHFEVTIFDSNGKEKALCCAAIKTASGMQTPNSRYVDNSSRSPDGPTQSSSREGSDSDGCPKESSARYCKSAKTAALCFTSEDFLEDNPSADESLESDDLPMLPMVGILSDRRVTVSEEAKINALVTEIQSKIPVLVILMKKINVEPYTSLVIPKEYARMCFPPERKTITLQVPRKSKDWQCGLYIRPDGRCSLRLGNFVRDNNVREGDLWLFQPITKVTARRFTVMVHLVHKASIGHSAGGRTNIVSNNIRTASTASVKEEPATDDEEISCSGYDDHGSSDYSEGASEPLFMTPDNSRLTQVQEKKVIEKVSAIDSELPIYVAVMNKSSVRSGCSGSYLCFAKRYVSRYLKKKYTTGHHGKMSVVSLVLQREGRSRTWDTLLRPWGYRDTMIISKGWSSFSRDNHLRLDDLCLFKLMENEQPLKMMVYIIRCEKC